MKKVRETEKTHLTNNSFSVLCDDLYFKIFRIINPNLTFRILCFVNKEFHTKVHLFAITIKLPFLTHIMRPIASNYSDSLFEWVKTIINYDKFDNYIATLSILEGNLNILKWSIDYIDIDFNLIRLLPVIAAKKGHLEILGWLKTRENFRFDSTVCLNTLERGHFEVSHWAERYYYALDYNICSKAAELDNLETVRWALENGFHWDKDTCSNAAKNNNLEILKWARENGCDWGVGICSNAAKNNNLEMLKWARESGCPWNRYTCSEAAKNGNQEVFKWAIENNCPSNICICRDAAEGGNLEILKWTKKNGCCHECWWDNDVCTTLAKKGYLETLKWARENGYEWDSNACAAAATKQGHLEFLKRVTEIIFFLILIPVLINTLLS
jgi:hypothetical protein